MQPQTYLQLIAPDMASTNAFNAAPRPPTLVTIPRELRDLIYEFIFAEEVAVRKSGHIARNSGILGSCKQLREEAMKPYYSLVTFVVQEREVGPWLKHLSGSCRSVLRHIKLEPCFYNHMTDQALDYARRQCEMQGALSAICTAEFFDKGGQKASAARIPEGYDEFYGRSRAAIDRVLHQLESLVAELKRKKKASFRDRIA